MREPSSATMIVYVLDPHDGTVLDHFRRRGVGRICWDWPTSTASYSSPIIARTNFDVYDGETFEYVRSIPMPVQDTLVRSGRRRNRPCVVRRGPVDQLADPDRSRKPDCRWIRLMSGLLYEQGMAVVGNELYVSGTHGPNDPTYEVAVYDTATFAELRRFTLPFDTHIGARRRRTQGHGLCLPRHKTEHLAGVPAAGLRLRRLLLAERRPGLVALRRTRGDRRRSIEFDFAVERVAS